MSAYTMSPAFPGRDPPCPKTPIHMHQTWKCSSEAVLGISLAATLKHSDMNRGMHPQEHKKPDVDLPLV